MKNKIKEMILFKLKELFTPIDISANVFRHPDLIKMREKDASESGEHIKYIVECLDEARKEFDKGDGADLNKICDLLHKTGDREFNARKK